MHLYCKDLQNRFILTHYEHLLAWMVYSKCMRWSIDALKSSCLRYKQVCLINTNTKDHKDENISRPGRLSIDLLTLRDFYTDVAFRTPYVGFFCLSELAFGLQSSQVLMALWCCVEPLILQSRQALWQWQRHHVASFTLSLFKSREKNL